MNIVKPCDSCEHSRVCGLKQNLLMAVDTIKDDIKNNSSLISVNIGCAEYREQPTRRCL